MLELEDDLDYCVEESENGLHIQQQYYQDIVREPKVKRLHYTFHLYNEIDLLDHMALPKDICWDGLHDVAFVLVDHCDPIDANFEKDEAAF